MFDIILVLALVYFLYKILMSKFNIVKNEQHLTETQRKWRSMKREQDVVDAAAKGTDYITALDELLKLQNEMNEYVLENKRKFSFIIWFMDTIDSRMLGEYIKHMSIISVIFLFVSFAGWSTLLTLMLIFNILIIDFLLYKKQLTLEVTEWNPEFREKFTKKFENLIRSVYIP